MINREGSRTPNRASRMLQLGRLVLAAGGALALVAGGARLGGSPPLAPGVAGPLVGWGAGAALVGGLLTAFGALEQRLIETRAELLAALAQLKPDAPAPAEPAFRSRPTPVTPRLRAAERAERRR